MLVNVIRFYAARLLHISPSDIGVFLRQKKRLKLFNQIKKRYFAFVTHRQQMQPSSCVTHSIFNAVRQSRSNIIYLYSIHTLEILEHKSTFNPVSITKGIARVKRNKSIYNNWTTRKFAND
jgi:hypothetical protein